MENMNSKTIQLADLYSNKVDVSGIFDEDEKSGNFRKGFKKLSEFYPQGFYYTASEPVTSFNTGELQGYAVTVFSKDTKRTLTVQVAEQLPADLGEFTPVDFENCLLGTTIKASGSGNFISKELQKRYICSRMVVVNGNNPLNQNKKPGEAK